MEIQSSFHSGVNGLQNAVQQVDKSASNIAKQSIDYSENSVHQRSDNQTSTNTAVEVSALKVEAAPQARESTTVTEELVNLRVAEHQALASSKVIATADEVVGSLIDTRV
ncbi:MAG: hypothetical protein HRU24_13735 [Gammaproteobacteria bacterium]|nr:hypothetical protein [Gammaproteobacteria bacterium]